VRGDGGAVSGRVVVAMSGGVDSSVAAALLVEQGLEVIGVTLRLTEGASRCCSADDAEDARRVAAKLGIRFYVADQAAAFRREVMEPFADAYLAGRTPVPCVACNRRFKFQRLLDRARALGADAVATGHYARIVRDPASAALELHRGADRDKDQSYFLFDLGPEQLARARFPVGGLDKAEVRARARALGLATADKPESQEICFVPGGDYRAELRSRGSWRPVSGPVFDADGTRVGEHGGAAGFTIGQRKGLGISLGEPRFVSLIDPATNAIVLGRREDLETRQIPIEAGTFVAGEPPAGRDAAGTWRPFRAQVRIRHRAPLVEAMVRAASDEEPARGGRWLIETDRPVWAIAPGQACVLYDGDACLGGGRIEGPAGAGIGAGAQVDEGAAAQDAGSPAAVGASA